LPGKYEELFHYPFRSRASLFHFHICLELLIMCDREVD
jgi:hypothetical protein